MYEEELTRIIDASQNDALTFFVGAGVSALSGAPTWKELIDAICDRLGRNKKEEYSSDEYLQIPQMYYEELDQVGYWCLINVLKSKDFKEFLGYSATFDFYSEYAKFDFSRFEVSWLLNLNSYALERIAKDKKVKEKVRAAIVSSLKANTVATSDSQRLNEILIRYFG